MHWVVCEDAGLGEVEGELNDLCGVGPEQLLVGHRHLVPVHGHAALRDLHQDVQHLPRGTTWEKERRKKVGTPFSII